MLISFRKITDDHHELMIERSDGRREQMECETRSYLLHDLLHYAVESEAKLTRGFWGAIEAGTTLGEMNDRARPKGIDANPELEAIEQIVGALHGGTKGRSAAELASGMRRFAGALGATLPPWFTEDFVERVLERMRSLRGRWSATPFGSSLELEWPAD